MIYSHVSQVLFGFSNLIPHSYRLSIVLLVDIKLRIFSETSAAEGRENNAHIFTLNAICDY